MRVSRGGDCVFFIGNYGTASSGVPGLYSASLSGFDAKLELRLAGGADVPDFTLAADDAWALFAETGADPVQHMTTVPLGRGPDAHPVPLGDSQGYAGVDWNPG